MGTERIRICGRRLPRQPHCFQFSHCLNMRDPIRAKSCTEAWLQAAEHLRQQPDWRDYNLVLEVSDPLVLADHEKNISKQVNRFLVSHGKHSVSTVINTIFPASFYVRHGADELFARY